MHVLQVVEHVIALKTSFLQKFTYIMHCSALFQSWVACEYIQSTHWLPLVILLARHERIGYDEEYFGDEHAS